MNTIILYLLSLGALIIGMSVFVPFYWRQKRYPDQGKKSTDIILKIFSIITIVVLFGAVFHSAHAMETTSGADIGTLNPDVGCVNLVGVPYGNNQFGNFLAWLSGRALVYPALLIVALLPFFPFRLGKLLNKWIALPIAVIEFITLFNICYATNGNCDLTYRNILLALQTGFSLSISIMMFMQYINDTKDIKWRETLAMIGLFAIAFIATLPSYTLSTLFSTKGFMFGTYQTSIRAYDLTEYHRFLIYLAIIIPLVLYFSLRNAEYNLRKVMLVVVCTGCLFSLLTDFGGDGIFKVDAAGNMSVNVNALPLHLCHTALYIVPICLLFNLKRLFYFTYFINVFGAICAMLMPNCGEDTNIFHPAVVLFWYNHIAAFMSPLLCVALGMFEKPKFKQMLWSLLFFLFYFIGVVFLNAWLSNYVPGGTDYFFINSDFICSKILSKEQSKALLGMTWEWDWGSLHFVIRPAYQAIFFSVYVVVAFVMWFIYALFFRVADSHNNLHNLLVVARKEGISMKQRKELLEASNQVIENDCLVFEDFTKRYGNSPVLSAKNINLTVKGGQIFGFLGPNGAGKSTCIKSAIGIQPVTSGHIFVCGHDVTTDSVKAKKMIGYVPDHYALYEKLTGREYINYIADLYGVSKADRDARIAKYVDLFELNQAFDNRMQTYSHGMKQKMTIMAALVHNPKVWILDEPLTGLDPQSIFQVKQCMLAHAAEGNIVFFSSHIIDIVEKLCTDIAIVKKGQIVFQDTMANIEKNHPEGLEKFYLSMIHDNGDLDEQ